MRLLAGNLRRVGADQVAALSHRLSTLAPDVVVLGEYGRGSGPVLASLLDTWPHVAAGEAIEGNRGVAVLSRSGLLDTRPLTPFPTGRCVYADLSPVYGMGVLAVHAPMRPDRAGAAGFWEAVMAAVRSLRGRPLAIVGDFDPARPEATALREAGFIEAGASGEGPHHLWFSPALTDRSPRCCCWYDRGWPIADRAALVCDLDP